MRLQMQPNAQEAYIWSTQCANVCSLLQCSVLKMLSACNVVLPTK